MRKIKAGSRRTGFRDKQREIYYKYMKSAAWRTKRIEWVAAEKLRTKTEQLFCYGACRKTWNLGDSQSHLHHFSYERLTNETQGDLWPLCQACHYWLHDLIEQKGWLKFTREQANKYGLQIIRAKNLESRDQN